MSDVPTFQESRRRAYGLLGDAADEIRAGDWQPAPTAGQREAIRRALKHIDEAKAALDEAADARTSPLHGTRDEGRR